MWDIQSSNLLTFGGPMQNLLDLLKILLDKEGEQQVWIFANLYQTSYGQGPETHTISETVRSMIHNTD